MWKKQQKAIYIFKCVRQVNQHKLEATYLFATHKTITLILWLVHSYFTQKFELWHFNTLVSLATHVPRSQHPYPM